MIKQCVLAYITLNDDVLKMLLLTDFMEIQAHTNQLSSIWNLFLIHIATTLLSAYFGMKII